LAEVAVAAANDAVVADIPRRFGERLVESLSKSSLNKRPKVRFLNKAVAKISKR